MTAPDATRTGIGAPGASVAPVGDSGAWRNRIVGSGEEAPDQLVANPRNWRTHPGEQRDALRGSLSTVGWVQQVLVNQRTGHVVDGHARVEEALSRDEPTVPVLYVDLDPDEEALVLATLDPISAMANTDDAKLRELLADVAVDDAGLSAMLGKLAPPEPKVGLTDPDDVPDLGQETHIKRGDLFALGDHRLMCGDSTSSDDVAHLMAGRSADAVWTSPPYGQQRDYGVGKVDDWLALMRGAFGALPSSQGTQILVNLGLIHREGEWVPYWEPWVAWMREQGWRAFGWYVWDQGPGLPGDWNGRLAPSFEFIFHFNRTAQGARKTKDTKWGGTTNHGTGLRAADGDVKAYTHAGRQVQMRKIGDSVIRVMRHKARGIEIEHPAVFPVELAREVMESFTDARASVYEPFSGSGSTLIGAEQINRCCYAMEIDPRYVAVAIERWEKFTGRTSERIDG